jgi:hypothetical protein
MSFKEIHLSERLTPKYFKTSHFQTRKGLRGQDLNLRPSGYEPDELPGCSTPRLGSHQLPDFAWTSKLGFHLARSCANRDYPPSGAGEQGVSVLGTIVFSAQPARFATLLVSWSVLAVENILNEAGGRTSFMER